MKPCLLIFLLGITLFSFGCKSNLTFLAISASTKADGGIYFVDNKEIKQAISLPTSNYIINSNDNFYVTLNRVENSKFGGVALLKRLSNGNFVLQDVKNYSVKTPCHLVLSPNLEYLYIANYSSSSITQIKLDKGNLTNQTKYIKHEGKSITRRQKFSHPHFVGFNPLGNQLFVCDLGTDQIFIYNFDAKFGINEKSVKTLSLPPGSGPRHLVFSKDGKAIFVNCELNSTVVSFVLDEKTNLWKQVLVLSTLKEKSSLKNNYPGAIKIASCGRYFFVTNRGHNSIAVYKVLPYGKFTLLDVVKVNGNFPSDILFLDKDKVLAVMYYKSNMISLFDFDYHKEKLLPQAETIPIVKGISLGNF